MASKLKKGKPKAGKLIRPWLCVAGVMFLWAAQYQPPAFTTASVSIWVLSSIAVGLIAGAVFAFVQPVIMAVGRTSRGMGTARADQAAADARAAAGMDEP